MAMANNSITPGQRRQLKNIVAKLNRVVENINLNENRLNLLISDITDDMANNIDMLTTYQAEKVIEYLESNDPDSVVYKMILSNSNQTKFKIMEMVTNAQLQKIHVLLNKLDLADSKKEIISQLTYNRTQSSKELTKQEAMHLISKLCAYDPCEKLKTIIAQLAYVVGITYGSTETDRLLNKAKLDMFLLKSGVVKKELQKQTYQELAQTHRQFEAIARKTQVGKDLKTATDLVGNLLNELNISTSKTKSHVKHN